MRPRRRARPPRPRVPTSSSTSARSSRRRASSSSSTASAVSPANHSSPRVGSQPIPSSVTAGTVEASSSSCGTTGSAASSRGSRPTSTQHRAEPGCLRLLDQLEPALRDRRRAPPTRDGRARRPSSARVRPRPRAAAARAARPPRRARAPRAAALRARRATARAPTSRSRARRTRASRSSCSRAAARAAASASSAARPSSAGDGPGRRRAAPRPAPLAARRAVAARTRGGPPRRCVAPRSASSASRPPPVSVDSASARRASTSSSSAASADLRRALDRGDARPPLLGLDLQPRALAGGRLRRGSRVARCRLEPDRRGRIVGAGRFELATQRRGERGRRLAAQRDPLAAAAQPVQRRGRLLARAGGIGQLFLGALALGDERGDLLVERAALVGRRGTAPFGLGAALGEPARDRASRSPPAAARSRRRASRRARRRSPAARAAGAASCTSSSRSRARSTWTRDPGELQLGAVTAALEAPEAGGLLDELAALGGLRVEHGLDAALRDHRA